MKNWQWIILFILMLIAGVSWVILVKDPHWVAYILAGFGGGAIIRRIIPD